MIKPTNPIHTTKVHALTSIRVLRTRINKIEHKSPIKPSKTLTYEALDKVHFPVDKNGLAKRHAANVCLRESYTFSFITIHILYTRSPLALKRYRVCNSAVTRRNV